jgi:hypothetical protein
MSPLTQGSISLREFFVEGEPAHDFRHTYALPLKRHAFRSVAIEKGETRAVGWVNPRQLLDTDVTVDKCLISPWMFLTLRQDRLAINVRLFRARRDVALAEAAAKAKKTRLSKNERKVIEDQVRIDMLRAQTPSTSIIEAAWHPEEARVYVAAASEAATLVFSELFATTFALTLVPAVAPVRAMRWAQSKGLEGRLAALIPTVFATRPIAGADGLVEAAAEGDDDGTA